MATGRVNLVDARVANLLRGVPLEAPLESLECRSADQTQPGVRSSDRVQDGTLKEHPVANLKSQIKRNRQNERRRLRNRTVRAELKTRTRSALEAAQAGEGEAEATRAAMKRIDKAAAQGILHSNTASRRKSRLQKRLNQLAN